MTNEDVIDLYKRVKLGTTVVVLAPHQGFNLRVAGGGNPFACQATSTALLITTVVAPVIATAVAGHLSKPLRG